MFHCMITSFGRWPKIIKLWIKNNHVVDLPDDLVCLFASSPLEMLQADYVGDPEVQETIEGLIYVERMDIVSLTFKKLERNIHLTVETTKWYHRVPIFWRKMYFLKTEYIWKSWKTSERHILKIRVAGWSMGTYEHLFINFMGTAVFSTEQYHFFLKTEILLEWKAYFTIK